VQLSDRRKASASALSSVPSLSPWSSQPAPLTFPTAAFDLPTFEVPAVVPARARPIGDHNRLRQVSMDGAISVRYVIEGAEIRAPAIAQESPLVQSKVATPATGFSLRRSYGRAVFRTIGVEL
jgi:hypothetical protein